MVGKLKKDRAVAGILAAILIGSAVSLAGALLENGLAIFGGAIALSGLAMSPAIYFAHSPNRGYQDGVGCPARAESSRGISRSDFDEMELEARARTQAELKLVLKRMLLVVVKTRGIVSATKLKAVSQQYEALAGETISIEALEKSVDRGDAKQALLLGQLDDLSPLLDEPTRRGLLKAAQAVADADDPIGSEVEMLLHRIARALGIP